MRRSRGERRRPADSYVHASGRDDLIGDQAVTEAWPTIGRRTEAVTGVVIGRVCAIMTADRETPASRSKKSYVLWI
jgi:hypothetical protein